MSYLIDVLDKYSDLGNETDASLAYPEVKKLVSQETINVWKAKWDCSSRMNL